MIYVGELYGSPDVWQEPVQRAIRRIRQLLRGGTEDEQGSLDLVFHVPGPILRVDWTGVRTGTFFRRERMLQVQMAVPESVPQEQCALDAFLLDLVEQAALAAEPRFRQAGIVYPLTGYLTQVQHARRSLAAGA